MTISEFINKVGFKVKNEDVKKVNDTIFGIKNTATKLLGTLGVGFSLKALNAAIEEFGAVNDSIRSSIGELENMNEIQQLILEGANEARTSYAAMAPIISNLVKSSPGLFPVNDAVEYATVVTKLLKTAGRSESTIQSIMEGLNKSFQKGIVDSETLNKLLEQAPEAANVLANHFGVAKSKLLDMATSGSMKVNDLKDAFLNSSVEINAAFENVDMRVSDALTNIKNKWGLWLQQTDKTVEITKTIAKFMVSGFERVIAILNKVRTAIVWMNERLGGAENLLKLFAVAAGAIFLAFNFGKITNGLNTVLTLIKNLKLKTLAIAAAVLVVFLLIEDFINFMQGNDSLLGEMLEKAGIDCDDVREKIKNTWEKIKTFLTDVWNNLKTVAESVFGALKDFWDKWGDDILAALGSAFDWLVTTIDKFFTWLSESETAKDILTAIAIAIGAVTAAIVAWKIVAGIASVVTTVLGGAFTILTSPITWIIVAIVALIAIIVLLVKNWDKVKAAAEKCVDWIKSVWEKISDWFKTKVIDPIVNFFKSIWDKIVEVFSVVANWFSTAFTNAKEGIENAFSTIGDFFKGVWDKIVEIFSVVANWFSTAFTNAKEGIENAFSTIGDFFKGVWDKIVEVFSVVANWFSTVFTNAKEGIENAFSTIGDFFKGVWDKIVEIFSVVANWFSTAFTNAKEGIENAFSTIGDFFKGVWDKIVEIFSVVANWFSTVFTNARRSIENAFSSIGNFFKGVWDTIVNIFTKIGTVIGNGIGGAFNTVVNSIISFAEKTINGFIYSINRAIGLINKIPGVSVPIIKTLSIPRLAQGGYVEANRPQTVIIGDNPREGEIVSPISKMRETFEGVLKMFATSLYPTQAAQVLSNSVNNRTITQNIEINNEFNGDRAIQEKASGAMDKSAQDITSELARGLVFVG